MDLPQDQEFKVIPIIVVVASVFLNLRIGSKNRIDLLYFDTFQVQEYPDSNQVENWLTMLFQESRRLIYRFTLYLSSCILSRRLFKVVMQSSNSYLDNYTSIKKGVICVNILVAINSTGRV